MVIDHGSARRTRSSNTYCVNTKIGVVLKLYATLHLPRVVFVLVFLQSMCEKLVSHEKQENVAVESTSDNVFTNDYLVALPSQGPFFFLKTLFHMV